MNSNRTTIRRGFAATVAATAFFAVTACGAEVGSGTGTISGSHAKKGAEVPDQAPRTSIPRSDFGDEYGTPTTRPEPAPDDGTGVRPGVDFGV